MEIVRTKSQSVALTTKISQFFDSTQNRDVINTVNDFRKKNGFLFKYAEHMFTGLAALFSDELDALKTVLTRAGGATSRSSITQVGLSNMIQYMVNSPLPEDTVLLDAVMFVIFQIHSAELRKGGATLMFENLFKCFNDNERHDKNEFISVHSVEDLKYILINGKTVTYVCLNKDAKKVKDIAHQNQHYITADTIGSMKKNLHGIDAVTFMTLKSESAHMIMFNGQTHAIGQLYYKQLAAEVSTLIKVKRANGGKVLMHGNTKDGFVRRMNDDMKKRSTGLLRALDSSNAIRFINRGYGRDETMAYLIDQCFLKEVSESKNACAMTDNINKLLKSKLLHDVGIGTACQYCDVKGTMDVIAQLTERNVDILDNIKEMKNAMTEELIREKPEPSVTERIVQPNGRSYMTTQEYKAAREKKDEPVASVSDVKLEDKKVEQSEVGQTFDIKTTGTHSYIDTVVAGTTAKPNTKQDLFSKRK